MNNFTSPAAPKARNTFAAKGGPQAIPVSQFTGQPLLAHQGRVVFECIQLADKVNSLEKFVLSEAYGKVSRKEQDLLAVQLEHMAIYLRVLDIRVAKFMDVKLYTCHKQVLARPMNRLTYNSLRGWDMPTGEVGADEGYLVEYLDGGDSNHPDFAGFISWSPKGVFERGYTVTA